MSKTLLCAPFVGEAGWEWCAWIPHIRYVARRYKTVIVGTRPGRDYLYNDFATSVYHVEADGWTDRYMNHGKLGKIPKKIYKKFKGAQILQPNKASCMSKHKEFCSYGQVTSDTPKFDLIIHARSCSKYRSASRNWPVQKFESLLQHFPKLKVASVGTEAWHIPGTEDLRNMPLVKLCGVLKASRLVIGPSSGMMHLAHLCKAPILVWSSNKKQRCIHATNRQRYERLWRAFDTPVHFYDRESWSPKVSSIAKTMEKVL